MNEKRDPKKGTAAELAELYPGPTIIRARIKGGGVNGDAPQWRPIEVPVEAMTIVQIGQMVRALGPIAASMDLAQNIIVLAANHPDEIIAAVAIAIGWRPEDVARLDGPGFMDVAAAVFEANADFFVRRLAPLVFERPENPKAASDGDGARRSPSYGATDAAIQSGSH